MKPWTRTIAALAVLAGHVAHAAEIRRDTLDGVPVVVVAGKLEYGDEARFRDAVRDMPRGLAVLAGPGGNLHAGIEIGRAIRAGGLVSAAPRLCASACALAWLGGQKRIVGESGRIGFHAAWMERNGRSEAVPGGNALVGAYLNQLGFDSSAILFLTSTSPDEVTWLTQGDARRLGIQATWGGSAPASAAAAADAVRDRAEAPLPPGTPAPAAATPAPTEDWASYGEWLQVASRQSLPEAVAMARSVSQRNANTNVFLYDNGWYAVTVGPYTPGQAQAALKVLVTAGEIPKDSLVTLGGRFVSREWGASPRPRMAAPVYRGPGTLRDD